MLPSPVCIGKTTKATRFATGKAMVYTAAAGVAPEQVVPVQVDVGCNTADVRDNPFYMGLQQVGGLTPASKPTTTICSVSESSGLCFCNMVILHMLAEEAPEPC